MGLPPYIPCPTPDPLGTNVLDLYADNAARHQNDGPFRCQAWLLLLAQLLRAGAAPAICHAHYPRPHCCLVCILRRGVGAYAAGTCNVGTPFGLLGGLLIAARIRLCIGTNQLLPAAGI